MKKSRGKEFIPRFLQYALTIASVGLYKLHTRAWRLCIVYRPMHVGIGSRVQVSKVLPATALFPDVTCSTLVGDLGIILY